MHGWAGHCLFSVVGALSALLAFTGASCRCPLPAFDPPPRPLGPPCLPTAPPDVTFTDIGDVLPLLQRNVDANVSPAALKRERGGARWGGAGGAAPAALPLPGLPNKFCRPAWPCRSPHCPRAALPRSHPRLPLPPAPVKDAAWAAGEVGATAVASLDWSDRGCYSNFKPPFDFILAADCVYSELAGEILERHSNSQLAARCVPSALRWVGVAVALLAQPALSPRALAQQRPHARPCAPPAPAAVPHLLATALAMGGPRTQTIVCNEFRSQARCALQSTASWVLGGAADSSSLRCRAESSG